ncbi:PCRF domain-containing protein [Cereibacter sphaeroides]|nr:PCRF domain-containing protein [Cereibacter sphaeroides]MCE6971900.1 PCRF domain-containing protein [Cereibacter sphaeroides]
MALRLEIRPAEGGADAAHFARDLMRAYIRLSARKG